MNYIVKYFFIIFVCSQVYGYNYTTCFTKRINVTDKYHLAKYPEGFNCVWEIFADSKLFGLRVSLNRTDFARNTNGSFLQLYDETYLLSFSYLIFEQNPLLNQQNQSIEISGRLDYAGDDDENSTFVSRKNNLWIVFTTSSSPPTYNNSWNSSKFLQFFPIFYQSVPIDRCEYPDHFEVENRDEIAFFPVGSEHKFTCNLEEDGFFTTINLTFSCILNENNIPTWNKSLSNCQQLRPSIRGVSPTVNNIEYDLLNETRENLEEHFSGDYPNTECGFVFVGNEGNISLDEYFPEKFTCNFTIEMRNSDEIELIIHNYSTNSRSELLVFENDGYAESPYNLSQITDFPKEFHLKTKKVLFIFWIPENDNFRISLTYSGKNKTLLECYPLKPPLNGYLSTNDSYLGTEVEFFCNTNYHLDGNNGSKCDLSELGNALWTNPVPNCLCSGTLHINKSTILSMSKLIYPTNGIEQNCIWNLTKPGGQSYNVYLDYNNNSAVEANFELTIKDANTVHEIHSESFNSTLTFIHTMLSNNVKFEFEIHDASNTNFSQIRIIFENQKIVCSYPVVNNGQVKLSGLMLGAIAVFTCNLGYEMIGEKKIICIFNNASKDLEWNREPPLCIFSNCSDQPNERNATAGIIVSPHKTSAGMSGILNCTWNIRLSDTTDLSKTIEISVHYFNLSNCLQIGGIDSDASGISINKICENLETPVNLTSRQKQISLRYFGSPNDTFGYKGFSVEYHVITIPATATTTATTLKTTTTTITTTTTTEAITTETTTETATEATTTQPPTTTTTPTPTPTPTTTAAPPPPTTTTEPPTTLPTTESSILPVDEDKVSIIVPLFPQSSLSSSGETNRVNKYDAEKIGFSSQHVVVYTGDKAITTSSVISAKNKGSKNSGAVAAGITIPTLLIIIIAVSIYIWYRKKYPVRMIVGKEFSNFTNPLYIKSSNTVSVEMNSEFQKTKPQFSLVVDKPNPIQNTGKDNLGFENEIDLKNLKNKESKMRQLESENIQLELRNMDSFDGQSKETEEMAEESENRVTYNASTNDVDIGIRNETCKTLDANVGQRETPTEPGVATGDVKTEESENGQENDAVIKTDDKANKAINAEESRLQVTDERTDAMDNDLQSGDNTIGNNDE